MKKLFLIAPIFLFFACSNNNAVDEVKQEKTIEDTTQIESKVEPIYIPDSLDLYLENPVDFYALKKKTKAMHSGGKVNLSSRYLHEIEDSISIYYDYWAIEFIGLFANEQRPLCFKVIKPWSNPEERYYDNDNETLVGIQSCLEWYGLEQSNFVNLPDSVIVNRFGYPDTIVSDCYIYARNDKFLSLKIEGKRVKWFKYFWLNYSFKENSEIIHGFVNW